MARHDLRHTKLQKLQTRFNSTPAPIVIPRNKLDTAFAEVARVKKENLILKISFSIILLTIGVLYAFFK